MSLLTIILLFSYEMNDYWKPKIQKDTYIASDPNEGKEIYMNLDITFPNAPCYLIDLELRSSIKAVPAEEVNKYLFKTRLNSKNESLD